MFYAAFNDGKKEYSNLYFTWEGFFADTFSPDCEIHTIINFKIDAGTYRERQKAARELAIAFLNEERPGLSLGELACIQDFFERTGRRYGLLKEFKENAIC